LVEIPHATDLTDLALRLGFSSHSHFTAAFRKSFGCTPSHFRQSTRKEAVLCQTYHPLPSKFLDSECFEPEG
jgi:AraC-like DNA-binding protein